MITVWLYGIESGLTEVSAQWADLQGIVCSEGEQIPIDVSAEGDRPTEWCCSEGAPAPIDCRPGGPTYRIK